MLQELPYWLQAVTPQRLDELAGAINVCKLENADTISLTMDACEFIELAELALDGMQARTDKMEIDMQNRDYFAKPVQGGRSSYDYGKSGPIEPMTPVGKRFHYAGILIGGFVLALVMFAWMA